jgi:hypothetical protein
MRGAIPPLYQYVFMAWCLVKHRDNFTFIFMNPLDSWEDSLDGGSARRQASTYTQDNTT